MINNVKDLRKKQLEFLKMGPKSFQINAEKVMIKPVFAKSEDLIEIVLEKLKSEKVHDCVIIDNNERFLGTISEDEIIKHFSLQINTEPLAKILNHGYKREIRYKETKDFIKNRIKVLPTDNVNKVIKKMRRYNLKSITVVNLNYQVLGIITSSSLINYLK